VGRKTGMEKSSVFKDSVSYATLPLPRNSRKSWPPNRGWTGGFLRSLAPRPAALALLRNSRKSWPPNRGWTGGFLRSLAPRPATLALLIALSTQSENGRFRSSDKVLRHGGYAEAAGFEQTYSAGTSLAWIIIPSNFSRIGLREDVRHLANGPVPDSRGFPVSAY
jgi:hypothetical protein